MNSKQLSDHARKLTQTSKVNNRKHDDIIELKNIYNPLLNDTKNEDSTSNDLVRPILLVPPRIKFFQRQYETECLIRKDTAP